MKLTKVYDTDIRNFDWHCTFVTERFNVNINPCVKLQKITKKRGKETKSTILGAFVSHNEEIKIVLPKSEFIKIVYDKPYGNKRMYKTITLKPMKCYLGYLEVKLSNPLVITDGYYVMCNISYLESFDEQ